MRPSMMTLVSSSFAEQWESSRLHTLSVALDGRLVRSNQQVRLLGSGAENHTNALMLCGALLVGASLHKRLR